MHLNSEFPNGQFGDPALYVWEAEPKGPEGAKSALLIDSGDLTRFSVKQLLKVKSVFLSHCHVDHFFGFDLLLRYHLGTEKTLNIYGPPNTSERVAGKLQGYTWNLIRDQNLQFTVIDLDPLNRKRQVTQYHARDSFHPSFRMTEDWNPEDPVLDSETLQVRTVVLDHRTPSMAYAVEEKESVSVDSDVLRRLGFRPGAWLQDLKSRYLRGDFSKKSIPSEEEFYLEIPLESGGVSKRAANEIAAQLLIPKPRHKIAYATDGAAHTANREALIRLVRDSDLFYSETCFLQEDSILADETKHFTARFIANVAQEARVKKLAPFHFSKRYMGRAQEVLSEIAEHYHGEIIHL